MAFLFFKSLLNKYFLHTLITYIITKVLILHKILSIIQIEFNIKNEKNCFPFSFSL